MPTVADVESIAKTLGSVLAGQPQRSGALTVIPILVPRQAEPEWLSPWPRPGTACASRPLLLLDGEQLVGAKQNGILNMTVLVAAQTAVTIAVSRVEQGRWGYRARHSALSDVSLYAGLRAKKSAWVGRLLREGRGHRADQVGADGLYGEGMLHGR